ncbi:hypothetical protein AC578_6814 [Pseudocercospora eumusae]|uniref:Uncharacterized protein n=1 Tax=Pseudocercospora eumusae TaxID=321146 RepID=A0A139H4R2_9PEZI|nr:hypothetical protein AC578_6814 [Pseudocercospora eumusae]
MAASSNDSSSADDAQFQRLLKAMSWTPLYCTSSFSRDRRCKRQVAHNNEAKFKSLLSEILHPQQLNPLAALSKALEVTACVQHMATAQLPIDWFSEQVVRAWIRISEFRTQENTNATITFANGISLSPTPTAARSLNELTAYAGHLVLLWPSPTLPESPANHSSPGPISPLLMAPESSTAGYPSEMPTTNTNPTQGLPDLAPSGDIQNLPSDDAAAIDWDLLFPSDNNWLQDFTSGGVSLGLSSNDDNAAINSSLSDSPSTHCTSSSVQVSAPSSISDMFNMSDSSSMSGSFSMSRPSNNNTNETPNMSGSSKASGKRKANDIEDIDPGMATKKQRCGAHMAGGST